MNEIFDIKLVQLYSSYVNDITDMHVIYYIVVKDTGWRNSIPVRLSTEKTPC